MAYSYTYLGLVNRVLQDYNEVLLDSSTFTSAAGFQAYVKDYVNDALNDIYTWQDTKWPFLWTTKTFPTVAGTQNYTIDPTLISVDWNSFQATDSLVPPSTFFLPNKEYEEYLRDYRARDLTAEAATVPSRSRPEFTVRKPDNNVIVSPVPDAVYTVQYDGFNIPTSLSLYTDIPAVPEVFRQVIIDRAGVYALAFRDNDQQLPRNDKKFDENCHRMRRILIPQSEYITFKE